MTLKGVELLAERSTRGTRKTCGCHPFILVPPPPRDEALLQTHLRGWEPRRRSQPRRRTARREPAPKGVRPAQSFRIGPACARRANFATERHPGGDRTHPTPGQSRVCAAPQATSPASRSSSPSPYADDAGIAKIPSVRSCKHLKSVPDARQLSTATLKVILKIDFKTLQEMLEPVTATVGGVATVSLRFELAWLQVLLA